MNMPNKKVKIITDSGCDISKEDEMKYDIDIMSFYILIEEEEYRERIDLKPEEFYEIINRSPSIPKTTQITVPRFEEIILQYYQAGYEDIIFVLINSAGSQTYWNALLAKENLSGQIGEMKVHIIDSHCYSLGYGYPIVEAAKKLNSGQNASSIISFLEDWFNCCEIYLIGFDLRHMKKSGRITAAASFLGELMGLKPIISMIEDKTVVVKKCRGEKQAINDAAKYCFERAIPETPWAFLCTTCKEHENAFIKQYTKMSGHPPAMVSFSGGVVSANAGTKFFGVILKGKPRK